MRMRKSCVPYQEGAPSPLGCAASAGGDAAEPAAFAESRATSEGSSAPAARLSHGAGKENKRKKKVVNACLSKKNQDSQ